MAIFHSYVKITRGYLIALKRFLSFKLLGRFGHCNTIVFFDDIQSIVYTTYTYMHIIFIYVLYHRFNFVNYQIKFLVFSLDWFTETSTKNVGFPPQIYLLMVFQDHSGRTKPKCYRTNVRSSIVSSQFLWT